MYYFHSAFRLDMHLRIYRKFVNVANRKYSQRIGFGKFFPDVPYMQLSVICIQVSGYPASRKIIISCDFLLFQVLKCLAFGKYIFKPIRYISDRDAFDKIKIRYFPISSSNSLSDLNGRSTIILFLSKTVTVFIVLSRSLITNGLETNMSTDEATSFQPDKPDKSYLTPMVRGFAISYK